jgi:hypothetical protein
MPTYGDPYAAAHDSAEEGASDEDRRPRSRTKSRTARARKARA